MEAGVWPYQIQLPNKTTVRHCWETPSSICTTVTANSGIIFMICQCLPEKPYNSGPGDYGFLSGFDPTRHILPIY